MNLWERAIEFHGHHCCVLAVGYRAAMLAREKLGPLQEGERLEAVVETADCSTDALQAVLRCTVGNRRLLVRDRGKHVFTVAKPGKAVRLALKPGIISRYGTDFAVLMEKVANGTASPGEKGRFYSWQQPLMEYILQAPAEDLFDCREVSRAPADPGFVFVSVACDKCGEEVFASFAAEREGKRVCPDCAGEK
ncbi:MAG: formylmethanofuran dehydrogenase [Peptococcaceae bacterium]|nr:formylmethanofuran dehydrogenase [Peptococcaceae bacterium]